MTPNLWKKTLFSERLTLIPASKLEWQPEDLQELIGWLNTPEVVKYSEQRHHRHTQKTQATYIKNTRPYWIIFDSDAMVGCINAGVDWRNERAGMGILLGDKHWGQGYGAEAWRAVMTYLFSNDIRKIEAGMMAANEPMINICCKCGMAPEGRIKGHFLWNEEPMDLVIMGASR
jgi:ribosomal-protein-alanine N-acetyltransferase